MIIADENINNLLIDAVKAMSMDVISISLNFKGMVDEDIIFLSKKLERIIITEDKDFGEWVFAHKIKDVSVILLRYHFLDTDKIIKIVVDLLQNRYKELIGKFTVVTINKIRIREI